MDSETEFVNDRKFVEPEDRRSQAERPTREARIIRSLQPPRILCVDDDPGIQTTIKLRLRDYRVKVDCGYYGEGIFEAVNSRPDLIITDLAMPYGDGRHLVQFLKSDEKTSTIPVIVLTGIRDPVLRHQLFNDGADAFLQKPIAFDELMEQMARFIDLEKKQDEPVKKGWRIL